MEQSCGYHPSSVSQHYLSPRQKTSIRAWGEPRACLHAPSHVGVQTLKQSIKTAAWLSLVLQGSGRRAFVCVTGFEFACEKGRMGAASSFRGASGDGTGSFAPNLIGGDALSPQAVMFVVGETEARREIPASLARRLANSPVKTVTSEEKCRRSEERAKVSVSKSYIPTPLTSVDRTIKTLDL